MLYCMLFQGKAVAVCDIKRDVWFITVGCIKKMVRGMAYGLNN